MIAETDRASSDGRVDENVSCIRCGYNLRGLARGGVCSECGDPVIWSVRGSDVIAGDPEWLGQVGMGLTRLAGSCIWLWCPLSWPAYWIGAYAFTAPPPRETDVLRRLRAPAAARFALLWLIPLAAACVTIAAAARTGGDLEAWLTGAFFAWLIGLGAAQWITATCLVRLLRRSASSRLVFWCGVVGVQSLLGSLLAACGLVHFLLPVSAPLIEFALGFAVFLEILALPMFLLATMRARRRIELEECRARAIRFEPRAWDPNRSVNVAVPAALETPFAGSASASPTSA